MKFTALIKGVITLALVTVIGTKLCMAEEAPAIDCTAALPATVKKSVAPAAEILACVTDVATTNTNLIFAESFRTGYCSKKVSSSVFGSSTSDKTSNWKSKNNSVVPQDVCERVGKVVDCAKAWKACDDAYTKAAGDGSDEAKVTKATTAKTACQTKAKNAVCKNSDQNEVQSVICVDAAAA